ncbi:hypothetical protein ACN28S_12095 [Cystobacter fuscus]
MKSRRSAKSSVTSRSSGRDAGEAEVLQALGDGGGEVAAELGALELLARQRGDEHVDAVEEVARGPRRQREHQHRHHPGPHAHVGLGLQSHLGHGRHGRHH